MQKNHKLNLNKLKPSATVHLHSLSLALKQQGEKVYSLAAGEPLMPIRSLNPKMAKVNFGYPPVLGLEELRKKASSWVNQNYECNYGFNETTVVPGAKMGIFLLLRAILKPGDQAAVIAPYWVSYPPMIELCYGKPVILKTKPNNAWKISANDIAKINSSKCKVLILNNASNPCGTVYSKDELALILSAAQKRGLFVISDEVYSGLVYDKSKFYSCGLFRKYKKNLAVVQSCSKNFAMPGIRTGFVFAPREIIRAINPINSQTTSGVSQLSQNAALQVLKKSGSITPKVNMEMKLRRNLMHDLLEKYWDKKIDKPKSALYFFLPVSDLTKKYRDDVLFCSDLLKKSRVIIVPGRAFGQKGYVRLSFGSDATTIKNTMKLLAKFCGRI